MINDERWLAFQPRPLALRAELELRDADHDVDLDGIEQAWSAGDPAGSHRIEGGCIGFVAKLITPDVYDRLEAVSTDDAFETARTAACTEGVWTGPSGGANILAATRLARELGPGHQVVTLQPDSGLKYLGGDLYR